MKKYEVMYIIRPELDEEARKWLNMKYSNNIKKLKKVRDNNDRY